MCSLNDQRRCRVSLRQDRWNITHRQNYNWMVMLRHETFECGAKAALSISLEGRLTRRPKFNAGLTMRGSRVARNLAPQRGVCCAPEGCAQPQLLNIRASGV